MVWLCVAALLAGGYPLFRAWRANRQTTLPATVAWAALAWLGWVLAYALAQHAALAAALRYLAVCLTLCASTAVLGARRPGVLAWNFVVIGLLVTLLLPLAQGWGKPRLETPWLVFGGAALVFGTLNYLPTRLGPAALLLGFACLRELLHLGGRWTEGVLGQQELSALAAAAAPWLGLLAMATRGTAETPVDRLWLDFRDRFGVVWGQRVREQFNRAAANAGLPVTLAWDGMHSDGGPEKLAEAEGTLRAVLRRFGLVQADGPGA